MMAIGAVPPSFRLLRERVRAVLAKPFPAVLVLLALPTAPLLYVLGSMKTGLSLAAVVDHALFVLLFFFGLACFARARRFALRASLSLAFVLTLVLFLMFILLNFRFFNTWGDVGAFEQWNDLFQIRSGITALVHPMDVVAGFLVPLGLWRLSLMSPPRLTAIFRWPALILAVLLGLLHWHLTAGGDLYEEQTPVSYLIRQKAIQFQLRYGHLWIRKKTQREWSDESLLCVNSTLYQWLGSPDYPFLQVPRGTAPPLPFSLKNHPNVVLILLESVRAFESGAYGAKTSFTPNLDRLAKEGVFFRHFYANGAQTIRSEFAIHTSYVPKSYGLATYIENPDLHIRTLPMILKDQGYSTLWIGSHSPEFDKKSVFLSRHGMDDFIYKVPVKRPEIGWGPCDQDLFDFAFDALSKQKAPFFAEIMTLSGHFPFADYPTDGRAPPVRGEELYQAYCRGMYYTDQAVGDFLDRVRSSPLAGNTVFIVTGDHGIWLFPPGNETAPPALRQEIFFRVPCIFWSPKLLKPAIVDILSSHVDIAPTLLDLLNIYTENAFLGNSCFRPESPGHFELLAHDTRWNLRLGNDYAYDVGPEVFMDHYPATDATNNWKVLGREMEHMFFHTDQDVLEIRGKPYARILSLKRSREMESLGREAFAVFNQTLLKDRVFPPVRKKPSAP